jgi:hypothetical protein
MKKILILQLVLSLSYLSYSQDMVIKGTKEISKKYTPQQVIDSLEKEFPNAKAVHYYKGDVATTQKGWNVTTENDLEAGTTVDYYTISFKQNGLQYYGLYNPDGSLVESKVEHTMTELPPEVVASLKAIAKDYPGYKVTGKTYYKTQNYSKTKEYYEVIASNGKEKKKFTYSVTGELLKVK